MTNIELAKLIAKMRIDGLELDEPYDRDGAILIPYKWQDYRWQVGQWEIEPGIDDMVLCTARYWATDDMQPGQRASFNGYPVWCAAEDMLNRYAREMFRVIGLDRYAQTVSACAGWGCVDGCGDCETDPRDPLYTFAQALVAVRTAPDGDTGYHHEGEG